MGETSGPDGGLRREMGDGSESAVTDDSGALSDDHLEGIVATLRATAQLALLDLLGRSEPVAQAAQQEIARVQHQALNDALRQAAQAAPMIEDVEGDYRALAKNAAARRYTVPQIVAAVHLKAAEHATTWETRAKAAGLPKEEVEGGNPHQRFTVVSSSTIRRWLKAPDT
jgi:hypothetical protein